MPQFPTPVKKRTSPLYKLGPAVNQDDSQDFDPEGFTPDTAGPNGPMDFDPSGFIPDEVGPVNHASDKKLPTPVDSTGRAIARPTVDPTIEQPDTDSLFSGRNIKSALTTPLTDIIPGIKDLHPFDALSHKIFDPNDTKKSGQFRNIASAGLESLGDELAGFTNPLNLGMALATEGGSALAKAGNKAALSALEAGGLPETDAAVNAIKQANLFKAANAARNTGRALAVPTVLESGQQLLNSDAPWSDRLNAVAGLLMGGLALKSGLHVNHVAEELSKPVHGPDALPRMPPEQPNLRFDLPDTHQPNLFDERPDWTGNARQLNLTPEVQPEPTNQGTLDFSPELSRKFTREFGPVDQVETKPTVSPNDKRSAFVDRHPIQPESPARQLETPTNDVNETMQKIQELKNRLRQSLSQDKISGEHPPVEEENLFPQEMRATKNPENVALGPSGLDERALKIMGNSLYSENRPLIAAKELLQNAVDEHRIAGVKKPIRFLFNNGDEIPGTEGVAGRSIEIGDQGRGVPKDQIYTVLTDLFKSGKANEQNASGGFGIAKAAPLMGGKYARFSSVVDEGKERVRYTFEGSPDQVRNQAEGVPVNREVVDKSIPTGLRAKVWYDYDTYLNGAREKIQEMGEHSHNMDSPIETASIYSASPEETDNFFNGKPQDKYSGFNLEGKYSDKSNFKTHVSRPVGKLQDTISTPGADIDVHYDTPDPESRAQQAKIYVANNGLHQFGEKVTYSHRGALKNVPSEIKFNVKSKVPEGDEGYPFSANREQLQTEVKSAVAKWIQDNIISGALNKQRQALKDMYSNMQPLNTHGTGTTNNRPVVLFDPHNALTPEQHQALISNPFITDFADHVDQIVHQAIESTDPKWHDKIEKTGITLDPSIHGIWIPNPENKGKATILINPFINISKHAPLEAARENLATMWHEVAHTGDYGEFNKSIDWSNVDANDPGVGEFFKKYMNEVQHANMVGDSGHGLDFLRNTAEVYSRSGTEAWNNGVSSLEGLLTNGQSSSGYSPEVQDALRIYTERERTGGTEKDILSGTGVNSDATDGGKESIPSNAGSNGKRPVRPVNEGKRLTSEFNKPIRQQPIQEPNPPKVEDIQRDIPQQDIPNRIKNISEHLDAAKKSPKVTKDEAENIAEKALNFQRTLLTSYDMSAPGRQGLPLIWSKGWWNAWKPMIRSWGSEGAFKATMDSIKNDPSGLFKPNEKGVSFANQAGLDLTDVLSHREEIFRSQLAEKYVPGVAPSVRAYTAYMNKLRADTFKDLVKKAGAENNLVDAKKIADFVNVATGRGHLGAFEPAARPLAQIFFSPRLMASRIQMYTRTFNPKFYADAPPAVRQAHLKSVLTTAGVGILLGQLSKMAGGTVNDEPTSSDYGKIRFGNTRIDPFAGHQQYLVAAARLLTGKTTSSTKGKTNSLTTGKFGMPTRADVVSRFMENKLAPLPSFIWSWMEGKDFDGTPFNAKQELLNRTVPIVMQDLHDIWKEDPTLVQGILATGSSLGGFGVQTYGR